MTNAEPTLVSSQQTDLLTVDELAERLRVKRSWIRDHARGARRPKIPGIKLGGEWRFRWQTIQHWLRDLEKGAAA